MNLNEVLGQGITRTLSELCFHFAEPSAPSAERSVQYAGVTFEGAWRGELVVGVEPRLLREFTENLLGEDAVSADDCDHALLEIANVICGNVLPELTSTTSVFHLGSPRLGAAVQFDQPRSPLAEAYLDDGAVMVRLFRDDGVVA